MSLNSSSRRKRPGQQQLELEDKKTRATLAAWAWVEERETRAITPWAQTWRERLKQQQLAPELEERKIKVTIAWALVQGNKD